MQKNYNIRKILKRYLVNLVWLLLKYFLENEIKWKYNFKKINILKIMIFVKIILQSKLNTINGK